MPIITFSNNGIDLKTKDLKNLYEEDFILQKPFITTEKIQNEMKESNIFNHIKIYNDEMTLNDFLLTNINDLNYSLIPFSTTEIDHIGFMDKGSCFSTDSLKYDHISPNQLIKLKEVSIKPLNSITQRLSIDKCEKENQQKNKHGDLVIKTYNSFLFASNYSSKEKDLISSFFNPKITIADNWTSGYEMETEWFKNNDDIKFWNNSYTLPILDQHSPLKYENVINNMSNKIKNENNFFVFGLGNQISGVQLNTYKLEQKIKEFFYHYSSNKTNYILNNLKEKLIENTNTFYSISQNLLPDDLKNNKSILFVGGYDQVNHHIWDDIAETYHNNSINLLENEDFLHSKLNKKEFYKGGSNFCLLAKENCLLADMSLLLNKENNKGTSFAAPRVLYSAYILKKVFPFLTNDQLGWLILSNATNINSKLPIPNEIYGYGVLNLNKSLKLFSKMNNLELQMDHNNSSNLKTNNSKNLNYKNIKIYTFGNDLTGNLFLKSLKTEKIDSEIIITNFKSQKNNNHNFNLKIGKNNIVIFQNDLKNTFIENNGILFLNHNLKNKQIIKTNIKNKGKIHFINFEEVNVINLIKQLN